MRKAVRQRQRVCQIVRCCTRAHLEDVSDDHAHQCGLAYIPLDFVSPFELFKEWQKEFYHYSHAAAPLCLNTAT